MYFASEETKCDCFRDICISECLHLENGSLFDVDADDSKLIKFIKRKLDKHLGISYMCPYHGMIIYLRQIIRIYFRSSNRSIPPIIIADNGYCIL